MTQGLLAAMIAKTAPADLRGTAYGIFSLVSGVGLLIASVVAGAIWETFGRNIRFMPGR
jgi:MFS family permease